MEGKSQTTQNEEDYSLRACQNAGRTCEKDSRLSFILAQNHILLGFSFAGLVSSPFSIILKSNDDLIPASNLRVCGQSHSATNDQNSFARISRPSCY